MGVDVLVGDVKVAGVEFSSIREVYVVPSLTIRDVDVITPFSADDFVM